MEDESKKKYSFLINYIPLQQYLNLKNKQFFEEIMNEISKHCDFKKISSGNYIKTFNSDDNYFYIILKGNVVELIIIYQKIYLTIKEYFIHLIILQKLNENYLLKQTIKHNMKIFPIFNNNLIQYCLNMKILKKEEINKILFKIEENRIKFNIENYLNLINIKEIKKFTIESKYHLTIPYYKINKKLNSGDFIDNLIYPKNIKSLNGYLCIKHAHIFYLNKLKIENEKFWKNIMDNNNYFLSNILSNIFSNIYIFKGIDMNFFINNFFPYFQLQKYKKGDIIINENYQYNGIYFTNEGAFKIKTKKSYNEFLELIENLKHSLNDFPNYMSNLLKKEKSKKLLINKSDKNLFLLRKIKEEKEITLSQITGYEILGLNEFYNYKTQYYHLTLEVISNEANVFFLPKTLSTSLINSFDSLNKKFAELIENKTKFYIKYLEKKLFNNENENNNLMINYNNLSAKNKNINKNLFYKSMYLLRNNSTFNLYKNIKCKINFNYNHEKIKNRIKEIANLYNNKSFYKSSHNFNLRSKFNKFDKINDYNLKKTYYSLNKYQKKYKKLF